MLRHIDQSGSQQRNALMQLRGHLIGPGREEVKNVGQYQAKLGAIRRGGGQEDGTHGGADAGSVPNPRPGAGKGVDQQFQVIAHRRPSVSTDENYRLVRST